MPCPVCCRLQEQPELHSVLYNTEGDPKPTECIRVDGASNEGPSHEEVQYWWTERHLAQAKVVTLATTRSSGSSNLNIVELQNSCLAHAHSSMFIPSTLHGSPISNETGKIDYDGLHKNLSTAIDVYIQRCNHAPIGLTEINLYRGAKFDQNKRENILVYLKGSKNERRKLQEENPEHYAGLGSKSTPFSAWTTFSIYIFPQMLLPSRVPSSSMSRRKTRQVASLVSRWSYYWFSSPSCARFLPSLGCFKLPRLQSKL